MIRKNKTLFQIYERLLGLNFLMHCGYTTAALNGIHHVSSGLTLSSVRGWIDFKLLALLLPHCTKWLFVPMVRSYLNRYTWCKRCSHTGFQILDSTLEHVRLLITIKRDWNISFYYHPLIDKISSIFSFNLKLRCWWLTPLRPRGPNSLLTSRFS